MSFDKVNQAALGAFPDLLSAILPGGKVQGREFVCGDLGGKAGRSLSINLDRGVWRDFARGDSGSDPVSLWAAVHGCSQSEAARLLATQLGLPDAAKGQRSVCAPRHAAKQTSVSTDKVPDKIVHPTLGQPAAFWLYHDQQGRVLGLVCRWDHPGGGKTIRPYTPSRNANGDIAWQWKGWAEPRPLYGLSRLAAHPDAPVLVAEGEPAAAAAQKLFPDMAATTWAHGAESASKADFSPLQGRTVYVWPDADEPGHRAAQTVCVAALAAGAADVHVVVPPEGVTSGWDLADALAEGWTPERAANWLQANSTRYKPEADDGPTFDIEPLDIAWCLRNPAPEKRFHARPHIPSGCVGVLSGTGAVGKSFLSLQLCVALACGRSFGPFEIGQPARALILNVEDDPGDLHWRLGPIVDAFFLSFEEQQLLKQNLCILPARGKLAPLMQLDERRNPQASASFTWLQEQVARYQPDLLVLDTKSRLFGLDENSNDHAAQWLSALERLVANHPTLSIMVVSHNSKSSVATGDTGQHAARGASALVDNARFVLSLTGVREDEARQYGGKAGDFVRLVHAKPSYSRPAEPAIFRRGPKGVLFPLDLAQVRGERLGEAVERLRSILQKEYPEGLNGRDLRGSKGVDAKDIRDRCLEDSGLEKGDWPEVIRFGLDALRLEEVINGASRSNNKATLIKAKSMVSTVESSTVGNCQEKLFDS
jgi:hypothetical protein